VKVTTSPEVCNLEITDAKEKDDVFCVGEQRSIGLAESTSGF